MDFVKEPLDIIPVHAGIIGITIYETDCRTIGDFFFYPSGMRAGNCASSSRTQLFPDAAQATRRYQVGVLLAGDSATANGYRASSPRGSGSINHCSALAQDIDEL